MSNDTLASKIELLQEQIQNLEKSGHFTEKEIDSRSYPLRQELEALNKQLTISNINELGQAFGITTEQMIEGRRIFNELWAKMEEFRIPIATYHIEVIDAEILTPNSITA